MPNYVSTKGDMMPFSCRQERRDVHRMSIKFGGSCQEWQATFEAKSARNNDDRRVRRNRATRRRVQVETPNLWPVRADQDNAGKPRNRCKGRASQQCEEDDANSSVSSGLDEERSNSSNDGQGEERWSCKGRQQYDREPERVHALHVYLPTLALASGDPRLCHWSAWMPRLQ
jgi:hypothetical protein